MKRNILILAIIMTMLVGFTGIAMAGTQDFTLVNNTGVDLYEIYISPSNTDEWEENVLHGHVLYNGNSFFIGFSGYSNAYWDIKIVDGNGNYVDWRDINLNNVYRVKLFWDGNQYRAQCN
ncbi:MAG: hypothetical protein H6Q74_1304 [Firmicutes bacterium]|nr:hypothetical protein [Bacillota bacterium]